ncbi:MAG: polyphosphate polymerase domain-containing protein [Treponema sp.]|nr:polyphosphate polymerase domain-containing protein [Treponema sp.]
MKKNCPDPVYRRRYEQKYLLNPFQYREIMEIMKTIARNDEFGLTTIYSLYYDTVDFKIARRALRKSAYREKLRLRSYGAAGGGDMVYLELKKKLGGLTYKQRIPVRVSDMQRGRYAPSPHPDGGGRHDFNEINWFLNYHKPSPRFMICCDRTAFRGIYDEALRITFDTHVRCRLSELDFSSGSHGCPIIGGDEYLMELKTDKSIPLFLSRHLSRLNIMPVSFSKHRRAYEILYCGAREISDRREEERYA